MSEIVEKSLVIRVYSKVIFLWPLTLVTLILWIIQWIALKNESIVLPYSLYANIWMWMFFTNLFIIMFDTGTGKFFGIVILIIIVLLLFFIFGVPKIPEFNISLLPVFYGFMFVIFAVFIMFGLIEANFNTWRFEKNEMIHRKGIFAEIKRYPTANLRYLKKIPDIFEYIIISSGSLTIFITGEDPILIPNVIGISRVAHRLDNLLSQIKVKMVE